MEKNGWGLRTFIILLSVLALCLIVVVALYNSLTKGENKKSTNNDNSFIGETTDNLKTYIDIEDKMTNAAKNYSHPKTDDIVVIKLSKLIESGLISVVKDPKNNRECSGYVIYDGMKKDYKAYLSCSGNYITSDYNKDFE